MACANAKSGVSGVGKVDMKEAAMDLRQGHTAGGRAVDGQDEFIPSRRRRIASAKPGGDEAVGRAHVSFAESKPDCVRRTQHPACWPGRARMRARPQT